MRQLLFSLFLASAIHALAQPPQPGFGRKLKTQPATPGLAQRLKADVAPIPSASTANQTLAGTAMPKLSTQPLRLRVVRDGATHLPVYIENRTPATPAAPGARINASAAAFQFMGQVKGLLKLDDPEKQFRITRTETDALGQTHIRMAQTHQGIPVYGGELIAHLTGSTVTLLNGQYKPVSNVSTQPRLSLTEAADQALKDVRKGSIVRSFGQAGLPFKASEGELCIYPVGEQMTLAYRMTVRPNLIERWEYTIDAQTGAVLDKYNHTCGLDGTVKASGKDLNGVSRSFQTYQESGTYYLLDLTKSMFDEAATQKAGQLVGAVQTMDASNTYGDKFKATILSAKNNTSWTPAAISAHYNAGIAYDYYEKTHKRSSLNGKGGTMISVINIADDDGTGLDNAFWNGQFMGYGNGNLGFKPLAGGLDVAGHEMTHGVIENAANLEYKGQSGAMNESMADVFGVLIDRDDWTVGEDVVLKNAFPSGALRSMADPNQNGKNTRGYQPKTMSQFVNTDDDNGGVHVNSGIPNYAFYLFASKIGKDNAEKVYYRTLMNYLTRTSNFLDLRLAVIRSATDLFGASSAEVAAAKLAFDTVGITETSQQPDEPTPDVPANNGQDMLLLYSVGDEKLYTVPVGSDKFEAKVSVSGMQHRPSVTDDGKYAYYVTADGRIRAINLTGSPKEEVISDEPIWANVTISRDGTKLAALTKEKDKSIWVYSYDLEKWKQFTLFNPTSAEGVTTGEVEYADSFEWDYSGEYLVYDAYNKLNSVDGDAVDYWDVGLIRVWNKNQKAFSNGQIEKLFSNLQAGESIGNPAFSKNSPNIIAFDYYNSLDESYYVLAADLDKGNLTDVFENTTLGFPSFSRLDDRLVFNALNKEDKEVIGGIGLKSDKITPNGSAQVLYNNAKWPVWYANGTRVQPTKTAQTIAFNELPDRYANDGSFTLTATASSKLTVTFTLVSGPATLAGSRVSPTGPGVVTIRATQAGNDQYAAATPVERRFNVLAVTGTEPTWVDALKVYPNPVSTSLNVELPGGESLEGVTLTTASGATVVQQPVRNRANQATLETSQLPTGLYILTVKTPKGVAYRKVVKQ